jgi:hypothetical protein
MAMRKRLWLKVKLRGFRGKAERMYVVSHNVGALLHSSGVYFIFSQETQNVQRAEAQTF